MEWKPKLYEMETLEQRTHASKLFKSPVSVGRRIQVLHCNKDKDVLSVKALAVEKNFTP